MAGNGVGNPFVMVDSVALGAVTNIRPAVELNPGSGNYDGSYYVDATDIGSGRVELKLGPGGIAGSAPTVIDPGSKLLVTPTADAQYVFAAQEGTVQNALTSLFSAISALSNAAHTYMPSTPGNVVTMGVDGSGNPYLLDSGTLASALLPKAGGTMTGQLNLLQAAAYAVWDVTNTRYANVDSMASQKMVVTVKFSETAISAGARVLVLVVSSVAQYTDYPIATLSCSVGGLRVDSCLSVGVGYAVYITNTTGADISTDAILVVTR